MITIKEVKTKKQQKEFINFPLKLYKGNQFFVPPLYGDEKKLFDKNYHYNKTCDTVYFLAYDNGKVVGRISGILQKAANEKYSQKRVRFTRFDSINNQEVASALFSSVEKWAKNKGMEEICGPLGFSDLEREGLLIEGFDQMSTFEEQYNADYYKTLIENLGYRKEVDWLERQIRLPKEETDTFDVLSEHLLKRLNLHIGQAKSTADFLKKYSDQFFEILDVSYEKIYQTVPFTEDMKKSILKSFKLIVDLNHIAVILDKDEKVVCFGLCFPSIAKAVNRCQGHLTPSGIVGILKAIKHPDVIDLGLVGVDPKYLNTGIVAVIARELTRMLKDPSIKYAETNLCLEENYNINNLWKRFDATITKRRRSYVKKIS